MFLYLVYSVLGLGLLLGSYTLFALSNKGWRRWATPLMLAIVYIGMVLCGLSALGQARPFMRVPVLGPILWGAALHEDDYEIRAIKLVEGQGIYLFLVPKNGDDPLLIVLKWDQQQAEALQDRMRGEAIEMNGHPKFLQPGSAGFDEREPLFYDLPHDGEPSPKAGE